MEKGIKFITHTRHLLKHRDRPYCIKIIRQLQLYIQSQESIPRDPVRRKGAGLIAGVFLDGDEIHVVELSECSLFRFRKDELSQLLFCSLKGGFTREKEDHDEREDIQARVESKGYVLRKMVSLDAVAHNVIVKT